MLKVHNLSYAYEQKIVLSDVSFQVKKGDVLAILGESGSGKSTLLKLIYGLLDATHGTIFWGQQEVLGPAYHLVPGMEFMKYLAQDFDLMPYTTVSENVGYFLSYINKEERQKRIDELLELVEMTDFAHQKVRYLSGGQMQRVALARILARNPEVLLLDEPFSHLDSRQRMKLSTHLFSYAKQQGITVLLVTHQPEEALMYADQMLVIKNGEILMQNTPKYCYNQEENKEVLELFGVVNTMPKEFKNEKKYIRPYQLTPSEEGVEVIVIHSLYQGSCYCNQAICEGESLFFYSQQQYAKGQVVKLKLSL